MINLPLNIIFRDNTVYLFGKCSILLSAQDIWYNFLGMACSGRAQTTACLKNGAKLSQFFSPRFAILQQQANVRKCSLNCQIGQGGEMTILGEGENRFVLKWTKSLMVPQQLSLKHPPFTSYMCKNFSWNHFHEIFREIDFHEKLLSFTNI